MGSESIVTLTHSEGEHSCLGLRGSKLLKHLHISVQKECVLSEIAAMVEMCACK